MAVEVKTRKVEKYEVNFLFDNEKEAIEFVKGLKTSEVQQQENRKVPVEARSSNTEEDEASNGCLD